MFDFWGLPVRDDTPKKTVIEIEEAWCVRVQFDNPEYNRDIGPLDYSLADLLQATIAFGMIQAVDILPFNEFVFKPARIISSIKIQCDLTCPNFIRALGGARA